MKIRLVNGDVWLYPSADLHGIAGRSLWQPSAGIEDMHSRRDSHRWRSYDVCFATCTFTKRHYSDCVWLTSRARKRFATRVDVVDWANGYTSANALATCFTVRTLAETRYGCLHFYSTRAKRANVLHGIRTEWRV
jgi:hypothetical protein